MPEIMKTVTETQLQELRSWMQKWARPRGGLWTYIRGSNMSLTSLPVDIDDLWSIVTELLTLRGRVKGAEARAARAEARVERRRNALQQLCEHVRRLHHQVETLHDDLAAAHILIQENRDEPQELRNSQADTIARLERENAALRGEIAALQFPVYTRYGGELISVDYGTHKVVLRPEGWKPLA